MLASAASHDGIQVEPQAGDLGLYANDGQQIVGAGKLGAGWMCHGGSSV
jgi:hypothetical protein